MQQNGYRAYPLVDHVADKVVTTFDVYGSARRPSSRYRDLVDLVAIVRGASIDAQRQLHSLRSEAERRSVTLPQTLDAPDRGLWETGYAREAAESLFADAKTLDEALAFVRPFIDPLLDGEASGTWDHGRSEWLGGADESHGLP